MLYFRSSPARDVSGEENPNAEVRKVYPVNRSKPAKRQVQGRQQSDWRRSKFFKKSEKKPCHASITSLFLTPKPNQTNGETNDKTHA